MDRAAVITEWSEREAYFWDLLAGLPASVLLLSEDGEVLGVNPCALDFLEAQSREQAAGRSLLLWVVDPHREALRELLRQRLDGVSGRVEIEIRGLQGTHRWVEVHLTPVGPVPGRTVAVLAHLQDITEHKRTESELRSARQFLQATLDTLSAHICVLDEKANIITVNRAWRQFAQENSSVNPLLLSEGNYLEICDRATGSCSEEASVVAAGIRAILSGRQESFEVEYPCHSPTEQRWFLARATRFPDHSPARMVIAHINITALKQAEEEARKARKAYEELIASIDGIVWEADANTFQFHFVSAQAERLLGYPIRQWLEEPDFWVNHIHPEDRAAAIEFCASSTRALQDHQFDYRMTAADGRVVWLHDMVTVVSENGRPVRLRGIMVDITARKEAELALRRSEERNRALIEVLPDQLFVVDRNGTVHDYRAGNGHAYPRPVQQPAGCDLYALFPQDLAGRFREAVIRALDSQQIVTLEYTLKQESERHFEARVTAMHTDRALVIARDVTEQKRAEAERRKFEAQMLHAQKLESLGVLAGGIAHDFNNLLTGILGYADLALLELPTSSPARSLVEKMVDGARRAAELTGQMLAYSGKGRFIVEPVNLSELTAQMAQLLQVSISKRCVLKYYLHPNLPSIEADAVQIRQVVMNLVINASEAVGDQDGLITITTGVIDCDRSYLTGTYLDDQLPEGQYVYLEVTDNGCGMPPDVQARIFEPFFTTKLTGRGLGLAAVLGIVRAHRGAIKCYSEPGKGTAFKVLLPVAQSAVTSSTKESTPSSEWRGNGTVLVVDDEPLVLELARHMLEKMGFTVLTADNGREGLEVFRQHAGQLRCVLLDMTMPQMDGEQTYREMRRLQETVPVILMSGYNEQTATSRLAGRGLAGFVHKPYDFATLARAIRKVLGE